MCGYALILSESGKLHKFDKWRSEYQRQMGSVEVAYTSGAYFLNVTPTLKHQNAAYV